MRSQRTAVFLLMLWGSVAAKAQSSFNIDRSSLFHSLRSDDSVTVYQCRVIDPSEQPQEGSGYAPSTPYTKTDKIVVKREGERLKAVFYSTFIRDFPNRKFSGLKIKERPYWQFVRSDTLWLTEESLEKLARLERLGREAMEYDYPVTRYTRNQVIIKRGKNFRQLVYDKPLSAVSLLR